MDCKTKKDSNYTEINQIAFRFFVILVLLIYYIILFFFESILSTTNTFIFITPPTKIFMFTFWRTFKLLFYGRHEFRNYIFRQLWVYLNDDGTFIVVFFIGIDIYFNLKNIDWADSKILRHVILSNYQCQNSELVEVREKWLGFLYKIQDWRNPT